MTKTSGEWPGIVPTPWTISWRSQQLAIFDTCVETTVPVVLGVLLPDALAGLVGRSPLLLLCVEGAQVLGWVAAKVAQPLLKLGLHPQVVFEERCHAIAVFRRAPRSCIGRTTGVHPESRKPTCGGLPKRVRHRGIAEKKSQPRQLVVHQRVHRIENQGANGWHPERLGARVRLFVESSQHRNEEALGLARASTGRDDNVTSVGEKLPESVLLVAVELREEDCSVI